MKVVITGVSGFVGSRMAGAFLSRGDTVVGISRSDPKRIDLHRFIRAKLNEKLDATCFEGADLVVHAAHDNTAGTTQTNVKGTLNWFEQAKKNGVRTQLYFTSVSAHPDAPSEYGKVKFQLERFFIEQGERVVRPGLVVGPGGRFGDMVHFLKRLPWAPVLGGNRIRMKLIDILTLSHAILNYEALKKGVVYNLFQPAPVGLLDLAHAIRRRIGVKGPLIPVSVGLSKRLLRLGEIAGLLPPPMSYANFNALVQSQDYDYVSSYTELGIPSKTLEELLDAAYDT